ncbi:MAG: ABC transporter ATP-binding protein [Nitrososphaeria archaeon]
MSQPIFSIQNLKKYYLVKTGLFKKAFIKAVDGVNFLIREGETYCIVGESGSGKTTVTKMLLGLEQPTEGKIEFLGKDLTKILSSGESVKDFRKNVQAVFQDPFSSLNPRKTVKEILEKPFKVHNTKIETNTIEILLEEVGLIPPKEFLNRYSHQLSGGQRQRVCIARALALKPKVVILDEPTAALDVTIKAQILNLLIDLKEKYNLTYIIISHELPLLKSIADKISVMYAGKVVEEGPAKRIFNEPKHPYTLGLLESIPPPDPKSAKTKTLPTLEGEPPSPVNPPKGCRFHPRCQYKFELCDKIEPEKVEIYSEHYVLCHLFNKKNNFA